MSDKELIADCGCPIMAFQKVISGKYKVRILWDLKGGPLRYSEVKRGLLRGTVGSAEIAPRVLSRDLKALTGAGLIDRKDYGLKWNKVMEAGGLMVGENITIQINAEFVKQAPEKK